MRDDKKALRFSLRLTCEHFNQADGCLAVVTPGSSQTKLVSVIPRRSEWDLDLLGRVLRKEKVTILRNIIMAHPTSFGAYEADLLQRFVPLAAVAIQNSQRALTLETKMLEAEKKHAVANLVRGVSHDINNALGAVLPLVQQIQSDIQTDRLQPEVLSEDLQQIEQSLQTCCRILGGMLSLAKGASQGSVGTQIRVLLPIADRSTGSTT
jgi:K+-sensing histidine kinase KdpD